MIVIVFRGERWRDIGKERIVLVLAKEGMGIIFWWEVVVDRLKDVPLRYLVAIGSVVFK